MDHGTIKHPYYNSMIKYDLLHITIFFVNEDLIDNAQQANFHKI